MKYEILIDDSDKMDGFIGQFGYVQYSAEYVRTHKILFPPKTCEITDCGRSLWTRLMHTRSTEIEYNAFIESLRKKGKTTHAYVGYNPTYYVDHCHRHGWIRGILCSTCNGIMRSVDKTNAVKDEVKIVKVKEANLINVIWFPGYGEGLVVEVSGSLYQQYANRCPDCKSEFPNIEEIKPRNRSWGNCSSTWIRK